MPYISIKFPIWNTYNNPEFDRDETNAGLYISRIRLFLQNAALDS